LIFDLDGTLVDSGGQIFEALNQACHEFGFEEIPEYLFAERLGLPIQLIIADLKIPILLQTDLIDAFRTNLRARIEESNVLFDGVEDFLKFAKKLGLSISIATSKPTYLAKLVVKNSNLRKYVDFVQGTDGFPAKPAPDVVLKCLREFNYSSAIMFGDRIEDIMAATACGIASVGIAQSHHTVKDLVDSGATLGFQNFLELAKTPERIWSLLGPLNEPNSDSGTLRT
jgi:phosphoglycolate phosphatase